METFKPTGLIETSVVQGALDNGPYLVLVLEALTLAQELGEMLLFEYEHPWTRAELEREIAGTKGNPGNVKTAIDSLYAAGLVHLSGELVIPTRPARRMEELNPGVI